MPGRRGLLLGGRGHARDGFPGPARNARQDQPDGRHAHIERGPSGRPVEAGRLSGAGGGLTGSPLRQWPSALTISSTIFLASASSIMVLRSEEHTSELQSLMRISYAVF